MFYFGVKLFLNVEDFAKNSVVLTSKDSRICKPVAFPLQNRLFRCFRIRSVSLSLHSLVSGRKMDCTFSLLDAKTSPKLTNVSYNLHLPEYNLPEPHNLSEPCHFCWTEIKPPCHFCRLNQFSSLLGPNCSYPKLTHLLILMVPMHLDVHQCFW